MVPDDIIFLTNPSLFAPVSSSLDAVANTRRASKMTCRVYVGISNAIFSLCLKWRSPHVGASNYNVSFDGGGDVLTER